MSFTLRDLSVLCYAQGFTLWHYRATDLPTLLANPQAFAECDMITAGDQLHISAPNGAALIAFRTANDFRTLSFTVWG